MPRKGVDPIIYELLDKGVENARSQKSIELATGLKDRGFTKQVERERREGYPIISQKNNGGGYYLPRNESEKEAYLYGKMSEIITCIETNLSIKHGKREALDEKTKSFIRALIQ